MSRKPCRGCGSLEVRKSGAAYCSDACKVKALSTRTDAGCWEWQRYKNADGYGWTNQGRTYTGAHRVSYEAHVGPIPAGKLVCHTCDNRGCVNPEHLFLGEPADNSADMVEKGRQARGERHHKAKLTPSQVLEIRQTRGASGAIAKRYGVSGATVRYVRRRENWKHVG